MRYTASPSRSRHAANASVSSSVSGGLAGTADQKNPQRPDPVLLHPLGDFTHFRGVESFLELLQNGVARALRRDSERAEAGRLHRAQQLGARGRRSEVRRVELHAELASRDRLANLDRVARRRVERRIDEVEMADACLDLQLLDLVGDELRDRASDIPSLRRSGRCSRRTCKRIRASSGSESSRRDAGSARGRSSGEAQGRGSESRSASSPGGVKATVPFRSRTSPGSASIGSPRRQRIRPARRSRAHRRRPPRSRRRDRETALQARLQTPHRRQSPSLPARPRRSACSTSRASGV